MNQAKKDIARFMVERLYQPNFKYVLIPCSGEGELAESVSEVFPQIKKDNIFCIDKNPEKIEATNRKGFLSVEKDIYTLNFRPKFDLIAIIPPDLGSVTAADDSILDLVIHCYNSYLTSGGMIAFVCPENHLSVLNTNKKSFFKWYSSHEVKRSEFVPSDLIENYLTIRDSHFIIQLRKK